MAMGIRHLKVSRFEREAEFGGRRVYLQTIILVDRIGKGSRITTLATKIQGKILQMSMAYWPKTLGEELEAAFPDYQSPFRDMTGSTLEAKIRSRVGTAPFERVLPVVAADAGNEEEYRTEES